MLDIAGKQERTSRWLDTVRVALYEASCSQFQVLTQANHCSLASTLSQAWQSLWYCLLWLSLLSVGSIDDKTFFERLALTCFLLPSLPPCLPPCSLLSHSTVVARELGLPTIVGVSGGLMKRLKTGMRVHVDAGKGRLTILTN